MTFTIRHAGISDVGQVRHKNEDRWIADPAEGLYVVADGMGGGPGGALAAEIVVETLPPLLRRRLAGTEEFTSSETRDTVLAGIRELSNRLRQESFAEIALAGMGATVVLAIVRGSHALIAHMGDSRAYLLRNGQPECLTKDHSIVQLLIEAGEISRAEATHHPARGQLTRFVGMEGEALPEARFVRLTLGDRLLLCTDGLSGFVSDERIGTFLADERTLEDACRRLIDAANDAGGRDNVTAVVLAVS